MALAGIMIGSLAGFVSFVTAWLIVGTGFVTALGIYFAAGTAVTALFALIAFARHMAPRETPQGDNAAIA
tara:strand:+ start:64128 stop:64337 length:210 start_codon:yes stop_codon:yes gene_type:complete